MAYSELVILYSLLAILALLRFYRRPSGEDKNRGPVRGRRRHPYAPGSS